MDGLIFSEDLCRLCLWRSNKLLPIFSEEGELQGIPGKIGLCLPISVTRDDFLPKLICSRCIYKLEMFSEFRNSCLRSEELLKRYTVPTQVQVESCQTAVVVQCTEDEVKLEVSETESIAVVSEAPPLMNLINEPETAAVEETAQPQLHIESGSKQKASEVHVNEETPVKARRNVHNCKYCSKNFPSRLQLSQHLTSSNCLFCYTCRYCAKVFVTAENRLHHEKNHKDKKNFICGICKQEFQSSFELNVHAMHGCEMDSQQPNKKTNKNKKVTSNQAQKSLSEIPKSTSQGQAYSCFVCSKVYRKNVHFQKHLRTCKRSVRMAKIQEIRRRNRQMKLAQKVNSAKQQVASEKTDKVHPPGNKTRKPSRRKQPETPLQDTLVADTSSMSSKASLLAVLGLKEKPKEEPEIETETDMNVGRCSPDVIVVEEVVTVCDICRKIFTSETGMLNHQITVHNRILTAEKIHTLMRVEI